MSRPRNLVPAYGFHKASGEVRGFQVSTAAWHRNLGTVPAWPPQ